jgi:hypothetical protein
MMGCYEFYISFALFCNFKPIQVIQYFQNINLNYTQYNHIIQSKSHITCVKVTFSKSIIFKVKITFEPNVFKWVIKTIFINSNPFALLITDVKILFNF